MSETRACQNCKNDFTIGSDDFSFYVKMKVPAPTFCRECRMIRRYAWRNNRSLYRCECALCKKTLIGMYKADSVPIMCAECYNGDDWNRFEHAEELDWTKSFWNQLRELHNKQPRIFQYRVGNVSNSDYGNSVVNTKDAYLAYSVIGCENVMYSESIDRSRDTLDSYMCQELDQCSWNISSDKNYNSHGLFQSQSCIDSYFLFDCSNCQNCCLSSNLRNQQYIFRNQKLSKEEYHKAIENLKLSTRTGWSNAQQEWKRVIQDSVHRYAQIFSSQNATGNIISNSKNITYSFEISQGSEDIRYSSRIITAKDLMDCYAVLSGELEYETMSGTDNSYKQIASILCFNSREMEYSMYCKNSSNCFGCVGLKNANYCILNRQYSKEEYEDIVPKLRAHMGEMPYIDAKGRIYRYGEFYPFEFSPFAYNETLAQDYFPLDSVAAKERGYSWKEPEEKSHADALFMADIPDAIEDVPQEFLGKTFRCAHEGACNHQCTQAFRIIDRELSFYKSKGLPLPETCPNCRHYERLSYMNPLCLYTRTCACSDAGHHHNGACQNQFETSYAPERKERVYCESCYQKSVL